EPGRGQPPVPAKRDGVDHVGVPRAGQHLPPRLVPDVDEPVLAGRGQAFAVRAERHAARPLLVSLERVYLSPTDSIPDLAHPVSPRGGESLAIRAEGTARTLGGVPIQRSEAVPAHRVPDLYLARARQAACAGDPFAVGTEGKGEDRAGVPAKGKHLAAIRR